MIHSHSYVLAVRYRPAGRCAGMAALAVPVGAQAGPLRRGRLGLDGS
jgi:hypothetical protein